MERPIRWHDYITINMQWFAISARANVLTPIVIPLLVQQFVGEGEKGTYVGIIRLWALMVAVLVQALVGLLSDRSTSHRGRRRPFIAGGTLSEMLVFVGIGLVGGLSGMNGFWVLFVLYILSMIASNTSHAATQGLIPDLVPDEKKGIFSGVKAFLELPLPLVFVAFVIGDMAAAGNLWGVLITLAAVMLSATVITMFAPEEPQTKAPPPLDWQPFGRLVLMTAAFTAIIMGLGELVKLVMRSVDNPAQASILIGVAGLVGMGIAIGLGVWTSIWIGIGEEVQGNRSFVWWVVSRLAFLVGATNLASFIVYLIQEKFPEFPGELAAEPAADVVMFVGIFILLTAVPSGWLSDRIGKKLLIGISAALTAAGTFVVIFGPDLTMLYVGGGIVGAGVGLFYSANWALGAEIVPKDKAGQFLGLSNLAGAGAGAVGAYIGGPIADQTSYSLLIGIYGVLFLLAIVTLFGIKEPGRV